MSSPSPKPKLAQLKTPLTSSFPSEISALSARSPLPGYAEFKLEEPLKTPITPPTAYTEFLKNIASPIVGDKSGRSTPITSASEHSDCSCSCESRKSPTSAPAGQFAFPASGSSSSRSSTLRISTSPAFSAAAEPPSSSASVVRSPFSARSARFPSDWDLNKTKGGRYYDVKSPNCRRPGVRQVREVVTRTVTYTQTPQMCPAPKGKRRKMD